MSERPRPTREQIQARRAELDDFDVRSAQGYERRRVEFMLNKFRIDSKRKFEMLRRSKERTGVGRLTLDLFNELCPNFPILLGFELGDFKKLHLNTKATLPALFKNFQDAPFLKAYERYYEQAIGNAEGRAVGLLFPRKGIVQGLIIHNGVGLADYWHPGTVLTYNGGTRDEPTQLFVQAFSPLIVAIHNRGHGWKPEFAD